MNIGEELYDQMIEKQGFEPYTVPEGTYENQDEDVETLGLSIIVFARDDVSEDAIYELTKSIYENEDSLADIHSSFGEFDVEEMTENLSLYLHPGAEKYYEEEDLID